MWPFKKKRKPMTPEQEANALRFIEQFANLYHGSVKKYGDDGHDQFVEVIERSELKGDKQIET